MQVISTLLRTLHKLQAACCFHGLHHPLLHCICTVSAFESPSQFPELSM
jgi:hypothetical protein